MRPLISLIILLLTSAALFSAVAQGAETNPETGQMLRLRDAIALGIEKNFNLHVDELNVPIRREEVTEADSAFDPTLESTLSASKRQILTGMVLYADEYQYNQETAADVSLRKRFKVGLHSSLSVRTARSENNSLADSLNPAYQNFLILNLTQPLLRDFGYGVNTSQIQISENQVQGAIYDYLDRVQQIAAQVEKTYFDLANALAVFRFRVESRELARKLLKDNRIRLHQGVVAITEVQQAETAVAVRDEDVIGARQRVEMDTNRLKDLLEIKADDPLYDIPLATEPIPGVDIAYPTQEEAVSLALKQRLDLQRLHLSLKNQDIRLAFFKNQKLPRLDLGATLGVNGLSGNNRPVTLLGRNQTSPLTGDYADAYSSMLNDDGYEWAVDMKLTYPIGNRAAEARYTKSQMKKRQLIYQVKRMEGGIETAVKNSLVTVHRSLESVQVAQRFENLAQTTLEQEMTRLKGGFSDTFRILRFQDDLISAHIRRINAVTEFHQGLAGLYREMGGNLDRYRIIAEVNRGQLEDTSPIDSPED